MAITPVSSRTSMANYCGCTRWRSSVGSGCGVRASIAGYYLWWGIVKIPPTNSSVPISVNVLGGGSPQLGSSSDGLSHSWFIIQNLLAIIGVRGIQIGKLIIYRFSSKFLTYVIENSLYKMPVILMYDLYRMKKYINKMYVWNKWPMCVLWSNKVGDY